MSKISAVYKITNVITGDFYIGSSKDVKRRWMQHKRPSIWNERQNNPMYLDMKRYGLDKFSFQILEEVEIEQLKETEQKFIETLKPTYNNYNAKGLDIERKEEYQKQYHKKYDNKYHKEYDNRLCFYNDETLTLCALSKRLGKKGIPHPTAEAKKYLIGGNDD